MNPPPSRQPWYRLLYVQVLIAVILGEDSARARDQRMAALVMAYIDRMN
mgnify:CR=1 FL=1